MSQLSFSHLDRAKAIQSLRDGARAFDLCIVGGGITGAAIARDAALRGLKTLLVEKQDFASGTSSRSSKLVHGGVRYLEQYEFGLVSESTRERARLWKLAPQLVTPLGFLFPTFETSRVPLWKLNIGLWLYDVLAMFRTPSLHKKRSKTATLQVEPQLRSDGLTGSVFYWDGLTDDALLTMSNVIDAHAVGACLLSRTSLTAVKWNNAVSSDTQQFHSLELLDELNGQTLQARARTVIVAAGPWTDECLTTLGQAPQKPLLAPTRGSHIVVPSSKLPAQNAVVMMHPTDGRVLFVIPWGEVTVIGTTDIFDAEKPENVAITTSEVKYLLDAANYYFPKVALVVSDVMSTWSGLRPLLAPPSDASASQVSREHHIAWHEPGLLVIAGGKLTTHREMAEQALEQVYAHTSHWTHVLGERYRPTLTHDRPLPEFARRNQERSKALGVSEAALLSLDDIAHICRTEMVLTLEDFMVRRTQIFYKEPENGLRLLSKLKDTLCRELNWSPEEWLKQMRAYEAYVTRNVLTPLGRI